MTRALAACLALAFLSACAPTVQTTSGADYIAARPEFRPAAGNSVERAVFDAANNEPTLRFPARLGLARIQRGGLTAIPPGEADHWLTLAQSAGPAYGTFVPISPLVADMAMPASGSSGQERRFNLIERIRIGAARQHVDAVLIYEVSTGTRDTGTALSVADLTIIGAFLIPSRAVEGQATANAILVDVRNGYPYGTATSTVQQTGFVPNNGSGARADRLAEQATAEAVGKLAADAGMMLARLKSELDTRELQRMRAAPAAVPATRPLRRVPARR